MTHAEKSIAEFVVGFSNSPIHEIAKAERVLSNWIISLELSTHTWNQIVNAPDPLTVEDVSFSRTFEEYKEPQCMINIPHTDTLPTYNL